MSAGSISWKLLAGNALLVLLVLAAATWLVARDAARVRNAELAQSLRIEASLLALRLADVPFAAAREAIDAHVAPFRSHDSEFVFVGPDGRVALDRAAAFGGGAALAGAADVPAALADGFGASTECTTRTGRAFQVVAVRVGPADKPAGVLVLARPAWAYALDGRSLGTLALALLGLALLTTVVLALAVARLWSRPLREIVQTARSLSRGDLSARVEAGGAEELALLARALNRMRERLVRNYETIDRQRRMLESLLEQLREGVVVAEADGRIALLNPAAMRLLNLPPPAGGDGVVGAAVERCIPQHDVQRMLSLPRPGAGEGDRRSPRRPPPTSDLVETRLEVDGPAGTTHLLAHACDLHFRGAGADASDSVGRLLVLTDITALTRTLQIRADFVTNASHELRTPLSTIRAAVETLRDIDLARDAAAATRFVDVIDRQSGRIEALARDLLDLARLEAPTRRFAAQPIDAAGLLADLRAHFAERLERKRLEWRCDASGVQRAAFLANPQLLRLALDNLIDNAIKFTEPGGRVGVTFRDAPGALAIEIADNGCGIPPEEQERVFERFYQVERARSGVERGTGLGLSIVRHATAALGGEVALSSAVGQGTRVTITLPQP